MCANGEVRLFGTDVSYEGTLEVCFNGVWGTVCHDRWDNTDATTVCNILGYNDTGAGIGTRANFFITTNRGRPILLDEVGCRGNETNILQCLSVDPGIHDCSHILDAGVMCDGVYILPPSLLSLYPPLPLPPSLPPSLPLSLPPSPA